MTLNKDNPKNKRPPMRRRTLIITVVIAVAIIVYALSQAVLSGKRFF